LVFHIGTSEERHGPTVSRAKAKGNPRDEHAPHRRYQTCAGRENPRKMGRFCLPNRGCARQYAERPCVWLLCVAS
jgi:hypothetical protein